MGEDQGPVLFSWKNRVDPFGIVDRDQHRPGSRAWTNGMSAFGAIRPGTPARLLRLADEDDVGQVAEVSSLQR